MIILFDNFTAIVFEAKYEAKNRKLLKLLIPKQMHQRLPIALAQLKAGNTSKNKLNKLCVYIYIYIYI